MTPTHDAAFSAVADPGIPLDDALKTFERAHRRSSDMTKGFALHWALLCRARRQDREDRP
jgi:hypothetical protein